MSKWTHSVCATCYEILEPGRNPVRIKPEFTESETCCRCGGQTQAGIFYRADPRDFAHCNHKED